MNKYAETIKNELATCGKIPLFEIQVITYDGIREYITCNISVIRNSLVAQRSAVSTKEEKSKFIASNRIAIDHCFSLDEHLQDLHDAIINDIICGDLYQLTED